MSDNYDEHWQEKELLNEVRGVGKGSRGGKGARKRRHPNKVFKRKPSQQQEQQAVDRLDALYNERAIALTDDQCLETEAVLKNDFQLDVTEMNGVPAILKVVLANASRQLVIKAGKRYLNAIIFAYALHEMIICSPKWQFDMYVKLVCEHTGIKFTAGFKLLHAVLRFAIDYEEKHPESDNRGKWSRDAKAIEYLIGEGIRPGGVRAFQKKQRGGVNKWSRLVAKPQVSVEKRIEAEVLARQIDRDISIPSEMDSWDDDDDNDGKTHWAEAAPSDGSREQQRLQKLTGGGMWQSQLLRYFKQEKHIAPGEGMITMVVGDPKAPLGVRLVGTVSVGHVEAKESRLQRYFNVVTRALSVVLGPKDPYTWNEAAWRTIRDQCKGLHTNRRGWPDR